MLQLIASILSWTDDQREKVGLQRSAGGLSAPGVIASGSRSGAKGHARSGKGKAVDEGVENEVSLILPLRGAQPVLTWRRRSHSQTSGSSSSSKNPPSPPPPPLQNLLRPPHPAPLQTQPPRTAPPSPRASISPHSGRPRFRLRRLDGRACRVCFRMGALQRRRRRRRRVLKSQRRGAFEQDWDGKDGGPHTEVRVIILFVRLTCFRLPSALPRSTWISASSACAEQSTIIRGYSAC